jgi:hypothetical protein
MKLDYTKPELIELGTLAGLTAGQSGFVLMDGVYVNGEYGDRPSTP